MPTIISAGGAGIPVSDYEALLTEYVTYKSSHSHTNDEYNSYGAQLSSLQNSYNSLNSEYSSYKTSHSYTNDQYSAARTSMKTSYLQPGYQAGQHKYGTVIDTKNTSNKSVIYACVYIGENNDNHGGYARVEGSNDNSTWTSIVSHSNSCKPYGSAGTSGMTTSTYRYFRVHTYGGYGGDRCMAMVGVPVF